MSFSKILSLVFKYAVMTFSASMTVYSLYCAFDGGTLGWLFGVAGIAVFEAAAMYWQSARSTGREGQIMVAVIGQWATMTLSLLSTLVGIALLTEWGASLRQNLPLGAIMIVLIGLGLGVNMFAFLAYEDEEPEAKRIHQQRMIAAERARMVYEGDLRALSAARTAMEEKIAIEAPILGAQLADEGMVSVREHNSPRQLPAPRQSQPITTPWKVSAPSMAMGGGQAMPAQRPMYANRPADGMNAKPSAPETMDGWKDDEELIQHRPVADGPKAQPRPTGEELGRKMTYRTTRPPEPIVVPEAIGRHMGE